MNIITNKGKLEKIPYKTSNNFNTKTTKNAIVELRTVKFQILRIEIKGIYYVMCIF
jgi:hypothetical protein